MANDSVKDYNALGVQFSTPDGDPRTPMLRALGLFIMNYAKVETAVQMYARSLIGISDDKARILLSGLRVEEIIAKIALLLPKTQRSKSECDEFRILTAQLKRITDARHSLVHNGVTFLSNEKVLSHKHFVFKDKDKFPSQEFTLEQLYAMLDDCAYMFTRFMAITEPELWKEVAFSSFREAAFEPWRYK